MKALIDYSLCTSQGALNMKMKSPLLSPVEDFYFIKIIYLIKTLFNAN